MLLVSHTADLYAGLATTGLLSCFFPVLHLQAAAGVYSLPTVEFFPFNH